MEDPITNTIVPPGVSGRQPVYKTEDQTLSTVADELALLSLWGLRAINMENRHSSFYGRNSTI